MVCHYTILTRSTHHDAIRTAFPSSTCAYIFVVTIPVTLTPTGHTQPGFKMLKDAGIVRHVTPTLCMVTHTGSQATRTVQTPAGSHRRKRTRDDDIKYELTGEEFPSIDEYALNSVFNPMYLCMRTFGLFWLARHNLFNGKRRCFDWCTLHCCLVLGAAWFKAFVAFGNYEKQDVYGMKLFRKICHHVFAIQMACGITSMVFYLQKYAPNIVKKWENYKLKHGGVSLCAMKRNIVMRVVWVNVISSLVLAATRIYVCVTAHELLSNDTPIASRIFGRTPMWLVILSHALSFYVFMAWMQSIVAIFCVTRNMKEEFYQLSYSLEENLSEMKGSGGPFCGMSLEPQEDHSELLRSRRSLHKHEVERYRQRHFELSSLVKTYDNSISCYLLFLYLFSIPLLVLITYALWGLERESEEEGAAGLSSFILSMVSLVFFVVILTSITAAATSLNAAVSISRARFSRKAPNSLKRQIVTATHPLQNLWLLTRPIKQRTLLPTVICRRRNRKKSCTKSIWRRAPWKRLFPSRLVAASRRDAARV